ncbi:type II toxin-antitoxin system RelE/ParE family toxin [Cellvibrio sp. pealriver]|uniref:type II toxin-antitoxin system RelE/ParE family toxin n=1 Tax=Cellvibrio sp. pealriver TaxID=1622269 RepID=UPI00066FEF8C|nr:type II toxin-antitoxin system RelE/ParE family toxin [Cellvibrio sp. pealriver]
MPSHQLIISPATKEDLKEIYQYGLRQWGQAQSDSYLENLKEKFWSLTEQPLVGTERPELLSGIRSLPIESHLLFYRVTASSVEIIRVLHARQDPARHLK